MRVIASLRNSGGPLLPLRSPDAFHRICLGLQERADHRAAHHRRAQLAAAARGRPSFGVDEDLARYDGKTVEVTGEAGPGVFLATAEPRETT